MPAPSSPCGDIEWVDRTFTWSYTLRVGLGTRIATRDDFRGVGDEIVHAPGYLASPIGLSTMKVAGVDSLEVHVLKRLELGREQRGIPDLRIVAPSDA